MNDKYVAELQQLVGFALEDEADDDGVFSPTASDGF